MFTWRLFAVAAAIGSNVSVKVQAPKRVETLAMRTWVSTEPFSGVSGVRELADGSLLVVDWKDRSVQRLTAAGALAAMVGRIGTGPGEYQEPSRLFAVGKDSTFVVDRGTSRIIVLGPLGQVVSTTSIAAAAVSAADMIRGVDASGNFIMPASGTPLWSASRRDIALLRVNRTSGRVDSIAWLAVATSTPKRVKLDRPSALFSTRRLAFGAHDDVVVAATGRFAILRASPYRVEWYRGTQREHVGPIVQFQSIPVSFADKKRYEPKGPPFIQEYPARKSPFIVESAVVDQLDNLWVQRQTAASDSSARWDRFDAKGTLSAFTMIPRNRRIVAATTRCTYVVWTDRDDSQWLECYAPPRSR